MGQNPIPRHLIVLGLAAALIVATIGILLNRSDTRQDAEDVRLAGDLSSRKTCTVEKFTKLNAPSGSPNTYFHVALTTKDCGTLSIQGGGPLSTAEARALRKQLTVGERYEFLVDRTGDIVTARLV